jgi:hypothetical protein
MGLEKRLDRSGVVRLANEKLIRGPTTLIQRNYTNLLKKLTVYLRRKMHG